MNLETLKENVNLIHVLFIAPLLLYVGLNKGMVNPQVYDALVLLGIVVLLYHGKTIKEKGKLNLDLNVNLQENKNVLLLILLVALGSSYFCKGENTFQSRNVMLPIRTLFG